MTQHIYDRYFDEKQYVKEGEPFGKFDIVINEKKCSEFIKKGVLCDKCFNLALIEKMDEFNTLNRIDFINYQLNKYSNPQDWLIRIRALLYDNEKAFRNPDSKTSFEYLGIIEKGIEQLKTETESKTEKKNDQSFEFINSERLEQLRRIPNDQFDFSKLTTLCHELNYCFENECYLAVTMLIRAIIDHIPPIFDAKDFQNVYGHYGDKTFREHMTHLDKSSRKIADSYLHGQIRKKERLPNKTQVNFSQDIDVLLAEICRKIEK